MKAVTKIMGLRLCQTLAWSRRQDRWDVSYIAQVMGVPCRSEERATAQNGVYERAERAHVTHPFCRAPSSVYLFRWFKESPFAFKSTTLHTQDSKAISLRIDDDRRKSNGDLVARWPAHPSQARPGRAPLIFDREALRAFAPLL